MNTLKQQQATSSVQQVSQEQLLAASLNSLESMGQKLRASSVFTSAGMEVDESLSFGGGRY